MVSKHGHRCVLAIVCTLLLLASCGEIPTPAPGPAGGGIDTERFAALRTRVEDLRAQGQDVAELDAIVADVEYWIAVDKAAEANLRIRDLEGALDRFGQRTWPTAQPVSPLPPAPAYRPVSAAGDTVLWAEDFAAEGALSTWETRFLDDDPGNMAIWRQREGALYLDMRAGGEQFAGMVAVAPGAWSDFVYSVDLYARGNLEVGVVFRYSGDSFYRVRLLSWEYSVEQMRVLERVTGDEVVVLDAAGGPGYEWDRWYNVQVVARGDRLDVYLDGELVLQATDAALAQGRVGVYGLSLGNVYFDNARVMSAR